MTLSSPILPHPSLVRAWTNMLQVVPTLTRSKAWECTLAAHSHDFATIAIVTKDTAENYCMNLQKAGLTISVAPDSNFKKVRACMSDGFGLMGLLV